MEYTAHPAGVPPRPAWTGVGHRVAGASTLIDLAEGELKESKEGQRKSNKTSKVYQDSRVYHDIAGSTRIYGEHGCDDYEPCGGHQ